MEAGQQQQVHVCRLTVKAQEAQTLPGTARLLSAGHLSRLSVIHPHACICTTVTSPPLSHAILLCVDIFVGVSYLGERLSLQPALIPGIQAARVRPKQCPPPPLFLKFCEL